MKVAITSTGTSLESEIDPRFGRCQYFIIVDLDDMRFEAVPNTSAALGGGVGIQAAKMVADKGAEAVITGCVGPNAHQVLAEVGLTVITDVSGSVREAAERYRRGRMKPSEKANAKSHAGMSLETFSREQPALDRGGGGTGMRRGQGCGRGGGMGMGRGMCRTRPATAAGQLSRTEALSALKEDARALEEQMKQIYKRIEELEPEES